MQVADSMYINGEPRRERIMRIHTPAYVLHLRVRSNVGVAMRCSPAVSCLSVLAILLYMRLLGPHRCGNTYRLDGDDDDADNDADNDYVPVSARPCVWFPERKLLRHRASAEVSMDGVDSSWPAHECACV